MKSKFYFIFRWFFMGIVTTCMLLLLSGFEQEGNKISAKIIYDNTRCGSDFVNFFLKNKEDRSRPVDAPVLQSEKPKEQLISSALDYLKNQKHVNIDTTTIVVRCYRVQIVAGFMHTFVIEINNHSYKINIFQDLKRQYHVSISK